jgi:hypothetical protein
MNCHACGTALPAGAKFCHKCGAAAAAPAPASTARPADVTDWRAGLPWGVAGLALGALIAVLALRGPGGEPSQPGLADASPSGIAPAGDISQMSTEEMARRLFDRVMRLAEEGKADSVAFFVPMALQTYAALPARDLDAHYDVGLLQLAAGDPAAALAEADTILAAVSTHLYGFLLRARASEAQGDAARAARAYRDFVRNETAERARARPEYDAHRTTLEQFAQEARARAGSGS